MSARSRRKRKNRPRTRGGGKKPAAEVAPRAPLPTFAIFSDSEADVPKVLVAGPVDNLAMMLHTTAPEGSVLLRMTPGPTRLALRSRGRWLGIVDAGAGESVVELQVKEE